MADQLYFARETKVYLQQGANVWELPVLDGYSFSQAINSSEVTLQEMAAQDGSSRRGRAMFNDSLAPAEWSISMYARPFVGAGAGVGNWTDTNVHAVEEALIANFIAINDWDLTSAGAWAHGVTPTASVTTFDFSDSNYTTLGEFNLFFVLGGCAPSGTKTVYKLDKCVVNSMSIDFDIDGISTWSFSGFGAVITEDTEPTATIYEATNATSNFIRNRLTSLTVTAADTATFPGVDDNGVYNVVLTGGSLSFENNISFLTPENLCQVNSPIGHVTGTRTIGGSFTAYLNAVAGSTADLFEDLASATTVIRNVFDLEFSIGGAAAPKIVAKFPQAHLEVPSHDISDVIGLSVEFAALPTGMGETDEATIAFHGVAY